MRVRPEGAGAPHHSGSGGEWRIVVALFGIALLVRLAVLPLIPMVLYKDAIYFDFDCVRQFSQGEFVAGYLHWVPPLFPLILAGPYRLFGDLESVGRVCGAIAGALTVLPVYGLARVHAGSRAAFWATLLFAVLPFHVRWSVRISSHPHFALLFAAALYAGAQLLRRPGFGRAILFAFSCGLGYWVRQEAIGLVLVLCGLILLAGFGKKQASIGRWASGLRASQALLLAGTILLATACYAYPLIWATHEATGRWTLSSKGGVSVLGRGRTLTELTPDHRRILWETRISTMEDYQPLTVTALLGDDPVDSALCWLDNVREHVLENLPQACGYLLVPFLLVGLFWRRRVPRSLALDIFMSATVVFYIGSLSVFYDSDRLLLALMPPMVVWSAVGLRELASVGGGWRRALPPCACLLLFALNLSTVMKWPPGTRPTPQEMAGNWIAREYGRQRRIMDPTGNVAYYAHGKAEFFALGSLSDVLDFAGHRAVEIIAASPERVRRSHPELHAILSSGGDIPGWVRVQTVGTGVEEERVQVFAMRGEAGGGER